MGERLVSFTSQWGEDAFLVEHHFVPPGGVFVDVGAGDPVRYSNTYYFEQDGWSGVCIDADPRQFEALSQIRTCAVVWAAVMSDEGEADFFRCDDPDFSTTLDHLSGLAARQGWGHTLTRVPAMKLETILELHGVESVDLLTIDTEGSELDVCSTLDWEKHGPSVVVIEHATWGRASQEVAIRDYFAGSPYHLVHRTTSNLIFVRKRRRSRRSPDPVV